MKKRLLVTTAFMGCISFFVTSCQDWDALQEKYGKSMDASVDISVTMTPDMTMDMSGVDLTMPEDFRRADALSDASVDMTLVVLDQAIDMFDMTPDQTVDMVDVSDRAMIPDLSDAGQIVDDAALDMARVMDDASDAAGPPDDIDMSQPPPDLIVLPPALAATNPFKNGNDDFAVGTCNDIKSAQGFLSILSGTLTRIRVQMKRINGPNDSVLMKVYEGGIAPEEGVRIATSELIPAMNVQVAVQIPGPELDFTFTNKAMLKQGSRYYFVVERTGLPDCQEINFYRVGISGDRYANGFAWTQWQQQNLAGWQKQDLSNRDLTFEVWVQP